MVLKLAAMARRLKSNNEKLDIRFIDKEDGLIEIRYNCDLDKSAVLEKIHKWFKDDDIVVGRDFTINSMLYDYQSMMSSQSRLGLYFKDPEVFTMLKLKHG